jgi:hypothetical protein
VKRDMSLIQEALVDNGRLPDDPTDAGVAAALAALGRVELTLSFDAEDPVNIEAAPGELDARIDAAIVPFRGHAFVENVARQIKTECRERVLQQIVGRAAASSRHTLN